MPMEELYVFGTGNAQATRCYNTCFAIKDGDEYFMVDAGGGNGILRILEDMDVDLCHIHNISSPMSTRTTSWVLCGWCAWWPPP